MIKRKKIIEQIEKENLLEMLAEKIYYKNVIVKPINPTAQNREQI